MIKFYDEIPEMKCFSGDTLPVFEVEVDTESIAECSMVVTIAKVNSPETAIIRKECSRTDSGFQVQITSNETSKLSEGAYRMNFCMTDQNSMKYIKLSGLIYVYASAGG